MSVVGQRIWYAPAAAAGAAGLIIGPRTNKPPPGWRPDWGNPINRGLLSWFPFNEGGGNGVGDIGPNGSHGTLTNMAPESDWIGSPHGGALNFNAGNDYVNCGTTTDFNFGTDQNLSAAAWVKLDGQQPDTYLGVRYGTVFAKGTVAGGSPGFAIFMNNERPVADIRDASGNVAVTGADINDGAFHHTLMSVDREAETLTLYVDGGLVGSVSTSAIGSISNTSRFLKFGVRYDGGSYFAYLDGAIDDVRVWERALSAEEAAYLHANPYG